MWSVLWPVGTGGLCRGRGGPRRGKAGPRRARPEGVDRRAGGRGVTARCDGGGGARGCQAAVDAPRFCIDGGNTDDPSEQPQIFLEDGFEPGTPPRGNSRERAWLIDPLLGMARRRAATVASARARRPRLRGRFRCVFLGHALGRGHGAGSHPLPMARRSLRPGTSVAKARGVSTSLSTRRDGGAASCHGAHDPARRARPRARSVRKGSDHSAHAQRRVVGRIGRTRRRDGPRLLENFVGKMISPHIRVEHVEGLPPGTPHAATVQNGPLSEASFRLALFFTIQENESKLKVLSVALSRSNVMMTQCEKSVTRERSYTHLLQDKQKYQATVLNRWLRVLITRYR